MRVQWKVEDKQWRAIRRMSIIHCQGSAIANGIEGVRGRNLDVGVSRDI